MTILLLGDITGRSRVAVRMQTCVLEARGHEVLALPTALISNTLSLGRHEALDTTDYLLRTLETWEALGVGYDMLAVGYVTGLEQAKALVPVMRRARARGALVLADPILGDNGQRYASVSAGQEAGMRLVCREADVITPNMTEACLLAGLEPGADAQAAIAALREGGARSVVITSAKDESGKAAVVGYDAQAARGFSIAYEPVAGGRGGTGDLFISVMIDALSRGEALSQAAREASGEVRAQLLAGGGILPVI